MIEGLQKLKENICTFEIDETITNEEVQNYIDSAVVALAVGGEGTRLKTVTGTSLNKNALSVGSQGETIVERIIKMYAKAGVKNFVALVFANADSIKDILKDGSQLGVSIKYSHDPEKPVGRGGAVLNALLNGSIYEKQNLIVHNPDDQIVNYDDFVQDIIKGHLTGVKKGGVATAIVTTSTPYTFTGMKINNGSVEEIEMYPQIPVPAHIGVTTFEKSVYPYFKELFNLEEKVDFESVLFPKLAKEKKLFAHGIENEYWIPVNDPKGLEKLQKVLS